MTEGFSPGWARARVTLGGNRTDGEAVFVAAENVVGGRSGNETGAQEEHLPVGSTTEFREVMPSLTCKRTGRVGGRVEGKERRALAYLTAAMVAGGSAGRQASRGRKTKTAS